VAVHRSREEPRWRDAAQERDPDRSPALAALTPATALDWQRTAGNQALARRLSRPERQGLLRAGDPAGMMKDHPGGPGQEGDPPDYTYHHIIPENMLHAFWVAVEKDDAHLGALEDPLAAMVGRGYRQMRFAAKHSLTVRLGAQLSDRNLSAGQIAALAEGAVARLLPEGEGAEPTGFDEEVERIVAASGAGGLEAMALTNLKRGLRTDLSSVVEAIDREGPQSEATVTEAPLEAGPQREITEHMLMWMPGNIHHGPTSKKRRNPKSQGFDADRDDGGDTFEVAARHLIPAEQYATLQELSGLLKDYVDAAKPAAPTQGKGRRGKGAAASAQAPPAKDPAVLVARIGELIEALTAFSVTEWAAVKDRWEVDGGGMWRVKPPGQAQQSPSSAAQTEAVLTHS
jgi:hypothetical protein